jgi:thymidylate kinase
VVSERGRSFTVALIGADGSGKTTVSRALRDALPFPTRHVYMGSNPEAATHLLPTSRLVRAVRRTRGTSGLGDFPNLASEDDRREPWRVRAHEAAWLVHRMAEEWYRQVVVWSYLLRGFVVVLDRHYYADYHSASRAIGKRLSTMRRLHAFLLAHVYPRPNLVVFLDAPPEVLLRRKGEGTLEHLANRRSEYLALETWPDEFASVDAARPLPLVVAEVVAVVNEYARTRPSVPEATR